MLKIDALEKVRLLSVDEKARTTDDGSVKTNPEFPGAKQWRVRIRYPERVRQFADGNEIDYAERGVSVWSETRPDVTEGSYVRLTGVRIGAYSQGNRADLYIWATGIEPLDSSSSSSASSWSGTVGGDDDDDDE